MRTTEAPVDVDVLRGEIRKTYTEVSTEQDRDFIFPTGRAWAEDLGYPQPELSRVPDASVESFAGVANPFSLGSIGPGETVLDLGAQHPDVDRHLGHVIASRRLRLVVMRLWPSWSAR